MSFARDYLAGYDKRRWSCDSLPELEVPWHARAFAREGTTLWSAERGAWIVDGVADEYPDLEWAYRLSQYYHGERFAAAVYEQLLAVPGLDREGRDLAETVLSDERRHVEALRRYLTRRLPAAVDDCLFPHDEAFAQVCVAALRSPSVPLKLATLHIMVEPAGVASMGTSIKFVRDEACLRMLERVLGDEAHHLQLAHLHLARLDEVARARLLVWLRLAISGARHSATPRQAYRRALPALADALAAQAEKSGAVKQQARRTALAIVRACRGTALEPDAALLAGSLAEPYRPDAIAHFPES